MTSALLACAYALTSTASSDADVVVVRAPGAPSLAARIVNGTLELETSEPAPGVGYRIRDDQYCLDWDQARTRLEHASVVTQFKVNHGTLIWNDKPIRLPDGRQIRNLWEAVRFRGWIFGLARTSQSDPEAALTPPFFATEIFYFKEGSDAAQLTDAIGAYPAGELGLMLLSKCHPARAP
jgi:hypothetical protein